VACPECLRIGARLESPKLTPEQLVVVAGNCVNPRHLFADVEDDFVPPSGAAASAKGPRRWRAAAHAAVVAGGVLLAGGAAYGMIPGELGHHGAEVVDIPAPKAKTAAEVLADAYLPAQQAVDGTAANQIDGTAANVVYVDAGSPSEGPSIVSVAFPAPRVSVLAIRDNDGACTFLRGDVSGTRTVTTGAGSPCSANDAPADGWSK
jgi:hypothetical protein